MLIPSWKNPTTHKRGGVMAVFIDTRQDPPVDHTQASERAALRRQRDRQLQDFCAYKASGSKKSFKKWLREQQMLKDREQARINAIGERRRNLIKMRWARGAEIANALKALVQ